MATGTVSAGRRLQLKVAGASALATLLAGCGGGGGASTGGSAGGSAGSTKPAGGITLLAGDPASPGYADGAGAEARFYRPGGLALDKAGNLYVADQYN